MNRFGISGRILVRNWFLNIAGQALPFLVGLVTVPIVVRGLGTERFGILALTWTLLGTFSVFDLGLGRAVTKFVAEALGTGERGAIPDIVWSAAAGQALFAALGGGVLAMTAPLLVTHLFNVTPELQAEGIRAFRIVSLTLPIVLVSFSFQGTLEAAQRFDVLAGIKTVSSTSIFLVPFAGVLLGWNLPPILEATLVVRALVLLVLLFACLRVLPVLRGRVRVHRHGLRPLLTFGAWITVSGLTALVFVPADRFVIGNLLTMTALTYYTIPQELISRLGVVTASMAVVLFPAFSSLGGARDRARLRQLFSRSTKYAVLLIAPAYGLIAVLAPDILRLWLGPALAQESAPVLRILAAGAAMQLLTVAPYVLLQGLGRADLTAKFNLLETPLYLVALWWLVRLHGIQGAALAWLGRVIFEGFLLLWAAQRMEVWTWDGAKSAVMRVIIPVAAVCALVVLLYSLPAPLALRAVLIGGLLAVFGRWVWTGALESDERQWMIQLVSGGRQVSGP